MYIYIYISMYNYVCVPLSLSIYIYIYIYIYMSWFIFRPPGSPCSDPGAPVCVMLLRCVLMVACVCC